MIGTHTVNCYANRAAPTGAHIDVTCLLDDASVIHGRADSSSQPTASAATLNVTIGPGAPLPPEVDIGAWITIDTTLSGQTFRRFVGRITDVDLAWDDAGEETPNSGVGRIVCVASLADYARTVVGAEPWPQELDGARVARIFAAAGLVLTSSDPGQVQVIPRDVDARAALELAQSTANSAGGLVWQTRDGSIRYADVEHRRGAAAALTLDACDILVSPTWTRNLGGLVNEMAMQYGVAESGGSQPVLYMENRTSKDKWGRYAYSVTTDLAQQSDAVSATGLILAQNSDPLWLLSALPVDMAGLDATESAIVLGLDVHALILLANLPPAGAAPTNAAVWVEGWTERLAWGVHELTLTVSDYCRTAPPPRWNDVPAAVTWDTAVGTWDSWSCWGYGGTPHVAVRARDDAEAVSADAAVTA
jgi:hypothetical protein